jgi:deoxycytidine triphosphate deaminase
MSKNENDKEIDGRGGMLSSSDFLRLVILENVNQAKKDFWRRQFEKHGHKFIIHPFSPEQLTPFSYDLTVGEQVYSCSRRTVENLKDLKNRTYWMAPGETTVIKTKEFVALPPCYSATVWPRFKMPVEGIFQSMVKIDPTWYGELGVAVTNLSGGDFPIKRRESFATLILYRLTSDTGMYLFREENLPEPEEVELCEGLAKEAKDIAEVLKKEGLDSICELVDTKIKLKQSPDGDSYKKLLEVHGSSEWKSTVIKCVGLIPRQMQGLGLNTLEIIRPTPSKVRKLTKEDVQGTECSETDLENTAIEHGKPFDLLAAIPGFVMERMERETNPRIRAEVEASVFPKTVTLTLTVLGFLSLIVAVAAFVIEKYRPKTPSFANIEWSFTVSIVSVGLAVVLLVALCILLFQRSPDSRVVRRLVKKIEKLEKKIEERN